MKNSLSVRHGCERFVARLPCGQANAAKLSAATAGWAAADPCLRSSH